MYEEAWNPDKLGFLPHVEFRTGADSFYYESLGRDFRGGGFLPDFYGNPHSLEDGYRLQTEKIPAGYRLLLLKEGEVAQ